MASGVSGSLLDSEGYEFNPVSELSSDRGARGYPPLLSVAKRADARPTISEAVWTYSMI